MANLFVVFGVFFFFFFFFFFSHFIFHDRKDSA